MKKLSFALFSLLIAAPFAQAQTISEALRSCGQEQNSLKRLVCYDGIVNDMERYSGVDELMSIPAPLPARQGSPYPATRSAAPQSTQPAAQSQTSQTPTSDFGLEHRNLNDSVQDKIYVTIAKVVKDRYNKLTVTLSDGQVWQQTDGGRVKFKENETAFIERGVMSAFFMGKDSANRRIRVKRIK